MQKILSIILLCLELTGTASAETAILSQGKLDKAIFTRYTSAARLTSADLNHANLSNLNYASAGHTGFLPDTGGSSGKTMCWKTATTLGYCSTAVAADGSCTCN